MKKVLVFIFFILISACEINKDNMIIEGQIIDLKNSKIYLAMVDEGKIIDSANVIDGKFTLKIFGKEAHQRKNEEGKYKVDFSMKSIKNGIDAGVTFKYDLNNPDDEGLAKFLNDKLAE